MSKKYCINCGALIPDSAKFCPSCGAPQQGQESKQLRAKAPAVAFQAASVAIKGAKTQKKPQKEKVEPDTSLAQTIERRRLSSNAVYSFFIAYLMKTSILLFLFLAAIYFEPVLSVLGLLAYLVCLYIAAAIVQNNFYYKVDEVGFQKSYGVIHVRQVTIPFEQVQNVNIRRSLTDRMLGLSRVSIETAGSSDGSTTGVSGLNQTTAEGYLPGLNLEDAKELHDVLLSKTTS